MSKEVEKLYNDHAAAIAKAKTGDKAAMAEKAKLGNEIRQAERESARRGVVLNPVNRQGRIAVQATETSSRRSLQEEYVRRFDEKTPVEFPRANDEPFKGTLRQYHADRLLRR